jgi:uncharacterized protein
MQSNYIATKAWKGFFTMDIPIKEGLFSWPLSSDQEPYLIGSKCTICGYCCFPKKSVCAKCVRDDCMEDVKFGPYAILDTYAVMRVAPPGFVPPYVQGYVILENGPKIFSLITGCETNDHALPLGQKMELVLEKIRQDEEGNNLIGWKFKPVEGKDI